MVQYANLNFIFNLIKIIPLQIKQIINILDFDFKIHF